MLEKLFTFLIGISAFIDENDEKERKDEAEEEYNA